MAQEVPAVRRSSQAFAGAGGGFRGAGGPPGREARQRFSSGCSNSRSTPDRPATSADASAAPELFARHCLALRLAGWGALLAVLAGLALWGRGGHRREENRRIVADAARRLELSPELLLAVAQVESGFDDRARSGKGALGLLQLMPGTGRETAARLNLPSPDLLDPADNALLGGAYLKALLGRYRQDLCLALAAYNAGPGAVDEWVRRGRGLPGPEVVEVFGFAETRRYVDAVLEARQELCAAGSAEG